MIYRVSFTDQYGEHQGYYYAGSRAEAEREIREWSKGGGEAHIAATHTTPKTKREVMDLLQKWGMHNDNG
jgi:hypothetical protein